MRERERDRDRDRDRETKNFLLLALFLPPTQKTGGKDVITNIVFLFLS